MLKMIKLTFVVYITGYYTKLKLSVKINKKGLTNMEKEIFLKYLELGLSNLNATKAMRFNIEGELNKVINAYTEEQIKEKVQEISYKK